jgi:hypothetical protein
LLGTLKPAGEPCFVAGTLIAMGNGFKPIEEIQPGDLVWSFDEVTSDATLKTVRQKFVRSSEATVELEIGTETVTATPEHPFWVEGIGWTGAGRLAEGDTIRSLGGDGKSVLRVLRKSGTVAVYNFEVVDAHSYFVSRARLLVHNACTAFGNAAKNGETAATKAGREAHKSYEPGPGFQKEVELPSGKRADAVNFETKTVKELKPNNQRAIKRGEKQVEGYKNELQNTSGGKWTGKVETYGPKK